MAGSVVNAQTTAPTVPTHAFIVVAPNPIGVNQPVTVSLWLIEINPKLTQYHAPV